MDTMIFVCTNFITIGFLIGTILVLAYKSKFYLPKSVSQYQLFFSFFLLIIGTTFDTLDHLGYSGLFDTYGEYINLLFFPLIIFSIFTYSLNRELEKRKRSEIQLQLQNEEYLTINAQLSESNEKIRIINEALSKTNMELDSFVYRVSHDLRAPICTAMGLTDLSIRSVDIGEIKHYLNLQETSLKRLDQFITDILDYSKNMHEEIVPRQIDFNQLIDSAFHDYQSVNTLPINVIKNIDAKIPFYSDLLRLKIIFNNLISNAIKFQKEGDYNQYVEITVHTSAEKALITIRDNGIGIPEKFQEHVFKIFFRAAARNTGSGLGLYIVYNSLQKINGSIKLSSEPNEGTTIEISIPNTPSKMLSDLLHN